MRMSFNGDLAARRYEERTKARTPVTRRYGGTLDARDGRLGQLTTLASSAVDKV